MLDVRPIAYVVPVAEQEFASLTPVVTLANYGTVQVSVSGNVYIYRESTGLKIYTSELRHSILAAGATTDVAALTPWSPPAPADDDYFIMCDIAVVATVPHQPGAQISILGPYHFDIKPVGMGPAPAAHGVTHAKGGSDELEVEDLATDELVDTKFLRADGLGGLVFDTPAGGGGIPTSEVPQVLTDQAAIDWDLALGGAATVTLGGNRTLNAPTNMINGAHYSLRVIQDGTGTRLITWDAAYRFPGGVEPALSAAINNEDILLWSCNGTNMDCVGMVSAVS